MEYKLPTHPSLSTIDPLAVCDDENPSQGQVLLKLIERALSSLPDAGTSVLPALIEDIAYSLHGNGRLDTSYLRQFLQTNSTAESLEAVQCLLNHALLLPGMFIGNTLPVLKPGHPPYSTRDIDILLAHQFLGSFSQPPGNTWGLPCFTSWFAADPAHWQAVEGYLRILLDHFAQGGYRDGEANPFIFCMSTANNPADPSLCKNHPNVNLYVVPEEFEPSDAQQVQPPFVLVAAHSQPGPGPTATHEERLQASSPALSISALVTPVIPPEAAVVTSSFPVHASWKGHNRTARLNKLYTPNDRPHRRYILADALQLDEAEEPVSGGLKDLQEGRIEREVRKLHAAFDGAQAMQKLVGYRDTMDRGCMPQTAPCVIEAAAWGCQAFGGNILAKAVFMMIASGLTGAQVRLTLLENRTEEIESVAQAAGQSLELSDCKYRTI
ncbi:hypothetical protein K432DRAFT_446827 [Lepidopterella palustris CBS 459.81]|uniref:PARG catalytic Macro domain-containing protein n=1 Tax=Lepidopterella palustris CBS 459.81 TaxID=1314670 RepID=A0A8E2JAD0_9PEZI|nr:hypothetical protein K432DRAFT_446827 [Lepidopterella palustris CBS 459.81]